MNTKTPFDPTEEERLLYKKFRKNYRIVEETKRNGAKLYSVDQKNDNGKWFRDSYHISDIDTARKIIDDSIKSSIEHFYNEVIDTKIVE
jgi:hypothetical protein